MQFAHLFEALMLVCFGFSWPLNVIKAYKARTAKGTSLAFIILIIVGYLAGITAKFINGQFNYVLIVYFLNLIIVMSNLLVYFRNLALDKKANKTEARKIIQLKNDEDENKKEDNMNYSYSLDEVINGEKAETEEKNAVILLGGSLDKKIPVKELGKDFNFNFQIYNKSQDLLTLTNAKINYQAKIQELAPEAVLLHLGESDYNTFKDNPTTFDNLYMDLIDDIRKSNKKCRIALVSVANKDGDKILAEMNRHIKAIADTERCSYVNLENVKLWNPQATKAAIQFAYSMGLNTRKPLSDVAEILYSYAFHNLQEEKVSVNLVG